jgi:hypothetical protein
MSTMADTLSEKRWAENQIIFRRANQHVPKDLTVLKSVAQNEELTELVEDIESTTIGFYCECSDEKCRSRIAMTPEDYLALHRTEKQFLVLPGHEIPDIEHVIVSSKDYNVIEKYRTPPETDKSVLNPTDLNHGAENYSK